jgi:hypothetical protein
MVVYDCIANLKIAVPLYSPKSRSRLIENTKYRIFTVLQAEGARSSLDMHLAALLNLILVTNHSFLPRITADKTAHDQSPEP